MLPSLIWLHPVPLRVYTNFLMPFVSVASVDDLLVVICRRPPYVSQSIHELPYALYECCECRRGYLTLFTTHKIVANPLEALEINLQARSRSRLLSTTLTLQPLSSSSNFIDLGCSRRASSTISVAPSPTMHSSCPFFTEADGLSSTITTVGASLVFTYVSSVLLIVFFPKLIGQTIVKNGIVSPALPPRPLSRQAKWKSSFESQPDTGKGRKSCVDAK
eukprot:Gb_08323 [translate_table: standard]